ncbi:MAG: twin-arginine translocase TatA/TatE family subunit [Actinomycetota bacterium]|nr:MAG: twin-arginine translocase TatA/TatE family subunit [Actinomycetota bacterium]
MDTLAVEIPRGWPLIVLVVVVVLLFGAKRLPDAARSIGRSLRIFKAETKGLVDDDKDAAAQPSTPVLPPVQAAPAPTAAPSQPAPPHAAPTQAAPAPTVQAPVVQAPPPAPVTPAAEPRPSDS